MKGTETHWPTMRGWCDGCDKNAIVFRHYTGMRFCYLCATNGPTLAAAAAELRRREAAYERGKR